MAAPPVLAFPNRPEDRLRLALRRLDEALSEQSRAVDAWRSELGALSRAAARLDVTVHGFQRDLTGLSTQVTRANDEARRLERTADLILTQERG